MVLLECLLVQPASGQKAQHLQQVLVEVVLRHHRHLPLVQVQGFQRLRSFQVVAQDLAPPHVHSRLQAEELPQVHRVVSLLQAVDEGLLLHHWQGLAPLQANHRLDSQAVWLN